MGLRVGGHRDLEVIAGLLANELDELIGITQLTDAAHAGRQVASQGHQAVDALFAILVEEVTQLGLFATDAGEMGCGGDTRLAYGLHRAERACLGGAAGAVGHRKETRAATGKRIAHTHQFLAP
ncbi:hypothetical protein Q427_32395 [Halomonas sp. BC04]|nr:hypothetical protein Q427_32395 [Halomonas sp. BC04]